MCSNHILLRVRVLSIRQTQESLVVFSYFVLFFICLLDTVTIKINEVIRTRLYGFNFIINNDRQKSLDKRAFIEKNDNKKTPKRGCLMVMNHLVFSPFLCWFLVFEFVTFPYVLFCKMNVFNKWCWDSSTCW